jgi:hypothetical protein
MRADKCCHTHLVATRLGKHAITCTSVIMATGLVPVAVNTGGRRSPAPVSMSRSRTLASQDRWPIAIFASVQISPVPVCATNLGTAVGCADETRTGTWSSHRHQYVRKVVSQAKMTAMNGVRVNEMRATPGRQEIGHVWVHTARKKSTM